MPSRKARNGALLCFWQNITMHPPLQRLHLPAAWSHPAVAEELFSHPPGMSHPEGPGLTWPDLLATPP